jgi:hypothetical protein
VGGIISFWWATSFRYGGRDHLVLVGAFNRNQHAPGLFRKEVGLVALILPKILEPIR